jgi:outer membrane protein assembly factor BamB
MDSMKTFRRLLLTAALALAAPLSTAAADWPTARGNPQRTGNVDGQAGPRSGKVLWAYESPADHFIASASPGDGLVYVPALGTLNSGVLHALSTDPAAPADKRVDWSKGQPFLKLPTVCAPAVVGGKLIFGDGMHQNENPTMYCVDAATGSPVWQLAVPGALVHLEGTPAVVDGRAYFGAGNGGVVCVDTTRLTLDGKDVDATAVAKAIADKRAEMQAKYEEDKKKDPDFAIPPDENALPKPAPRLAWQQGGNGGFHVDSPVAVVEGSVLVASSKIPEGAGECALICLSAADGKTKWKAPLKLNPWAGPSVSGPVAIVGCSSIRFDPKEISGAKGEVVAVNLADGSVKWRNDVNGGVVSPVVVAGDLAIYTATDGQVRAVDAATGEPRWSFNGKAPYFAGVAVAGDLVYAANLNGVVHAINRADGKQVWRLDIGRETKAPGSVYGSPIVHGGKLYVGTCNVDAGEARKTVFVCIGEK